MFLNILRISASNVVKVFSNIIVRIGFSLFCYFAIRTNQPPKNIIIKVYTSL